MKKKIDQEEYHLSEIDQGIDSLNIWFVINTIFTILTGLAILFLALLEYFKK